MLALQRMEKKGVLPNTDIFTEEGRARLQSLMQIRRVQAGAYVFEEGERADKLYWMVKGKVKLTKASQDGKQMLFSLYGEGDMFGQFTPYLAQVHSVGAQALEDCEIGILYRKELEALLLNDRELSMCMMQWLGLNQSIMESKFRDLVLFGKSGALCSVLIRLSNTFGIAYGSDICIAHKMTNTELAEMIGSTREGVNRMLADMKQEGIIANLNGHLVIKDLGFLRRMCQCDQCPVGICRM